MKQKTIFAAIFVFGALVFFHLHASTQDAPKSADNVHEIKMTAKKFVFEPSTVRVKKGEHVRLVVTSTDRDHGIAIDDLHINRRLSAGKPETIEFTADKAGTFPFRCSVVCGGDHGNMVGSVVVEE